MLSSIIVCASLAVYDGDTVRCKPSGQLLRLLGEGVVGVRGIDTPEIGRRAKCPHELALGKKAKARLEELLAGGKVRIEMKGVDRFDRPLVNIYLPDGREAGRVMLEEGHAREWRRQVKNDWCNPGA